MRNFLAALALSCCFGVGALADRAVAADFGPAAAQPAGAAYATVHVAHFGKHYRRAEPPYAFYPPPRVRLRCFKTRWGDVSCPYRAWGKKDTGACWYEYGRRVCGPAFYRTWPYQKAKPAMPLIDQRANVVPHGKAPVRPYRPAPAYPHPVK